MPMDYRIDEDRNVVLMRGWGRLVNEEMVDCIARLRADERLKPGMNTLSDMRDVTDMAIDIEGITATDKVMVETRERRGAARIAIIVKDLPDEMMAKLLDASTHTDSPGLEIRPFEIVDEAEAWLGIQS